ncbi:hypothetical protein [Halobaculum sp. MBLA0143]|uniref:hypothetical protein n=1 Tax=Halobaculum sp. MBLA0143 TaxID=3079933 RepID=UPI003523C2E9
MCSNTSPSEKHDGTVDVSELCDQYEQHVETVEQLPLPAHRIDSLVAETETVRETLATDGAVPARTLQTLLCVIAEAIGDVEHARTVSPTAARDADRRDSDPRPELTPDEQATCLDALSQLQFAVVETPVGSD